MSGVDRAAARGQAPGEAPVHPIEAESYRRLRAAADTTHLAPLARAVTERIVHATADVDFVDDVVAAEADLEAGVAALARGAALVADVGMVVAGLSGDLRQRAICRVDDPRAGEQARRTGATRSACGLRLALAEAGGDAVVVIGCAPTAAAALAADWPAMDPRADSARPARSHSTRPARSHSTRPTRSHSARPTRPVLVIAVPVGFVGAVEAKAAVRDAGVPAVTNRSAKGGSPAAAAAVNALAAHARGARP